MTTERWGPLPCGTDPARLLQYVADGYHPSARSHEADCAWCQTTMAEMSGLWGPVRDWARRDITVPDHLVTTVLRRVRRIVQSPRHVAAVSARGRTTVNSWVLGLIASTVTRKTRGVARITGTPSEAGEPSATRYGADGVDVTELGAADIALRFGVTARPVQSLPDLANDLRDNIIAAIATQTDIRVTEVDIRIDDLDTDDRQ